MTIQHTGKARMTAPDARKPIAMLMLAALFWGTGNVANKTILQDLDPFAVVTLRHLIAVAALVPLVWRETGPTPARLWVPGVGPASLLFSAATLAQQCGYQTATVTNASFLVNTACVLTPILALVLFRDPLRWPTVLAAGLTLIGALLMSGAATSPTAMNTGDQMCLLSALLYAGWIVMLGRHIALHGRPMAATLAQCALAALIALPIAASTDSDLVRNWTGALPEALYLGLFSTAAAFALTSAAQQVVSAQVAAVLVSAESLFGAACGIVFLGERPAALAILGAAVMLLAILLVSLPACRPSLGQHKS